MPVISSNTSFAMSMTMDVSGIERINICLLYLSFIIAALLLVFNDEGNLWNQSLPIVDIVRLLFSGQSAA